jgi:uroporphyrinogen decarboxylase
MSYGATKEATDKLLEHMSLPDLDAVFERLHIDQVVGVGGKYVGPEVTEGENCFGCRFVNASYELGSYWECVHAPLAEFNTVEEIEANYTWPEPDWWDYSSLPQEIKGNEHLPITGGGCSVHLVYCQLRGLEQGFADFLEYPEIVSYCLDKLFELDYQRTVRIVETIPGALQYSFVAEDFGSQESLLCSTDHIDEFLMPGMKRTIDVIHQAGAHVLFHSDGAIRPLLKSMIDAGIDVLNPVQWRCAGMEREGLKADFGDDLIFHGGMDNQQTMAFGTVEDVRQEVHDNIAILGDGGGYILAPCHNIQAITPPENIVALYEQGYEEGWL